MNGRVFRKQEFIDLLGQFRNVYEMSCKSMVDIADTEFDVVLMDAYNHVCRYFTSTITKTFWQSQCQISFWYVTLFSVKFYFEVYEINVAHSDVAFLFFAEYIKLTTSLFTIHMCEFEIQMSVFDMKLFLFKLFYINENNILKIHRVVVEFELLVLW